MFESLTEIVSGSPWTYAFLVGISALDVIFPVVPSETSVILAGVLAAAGDLVLLLVIAAAACGAVIGDNVAYWIGRTAGGPIERRFFSGERRSKLDWAEGQLRQRGGYLILIARFIPGGRTAVTLSAGLLRMRYAKFFAFDLAAGIAWGGYAGLLGYFGGKAFEKEPWKGFVLAFAIALAITGITEVVRWIRKRTAAA